MKKPLAASELAAIAKGVGDLVAHYDEVLALINRQPSGRYITKDGKTCSYRIRIQ